MIFGTKKGNFGWVETPVQFSVYGPKFTDKQMNKKY